MRAAGVGNVARRFGLMLQKGTVSPGVKKYRQGKEAYVLKGDAL